MAESREQSVEKGRLHRGLFAWINRPMHFEWSCASLAWIAVAIGVILRIWEYFELRTLYMDEASLLKNIVGRPVFSFQEVLEDDQMAPPAFLVIERLLVLLPLEVKAAGRLFPLVCGIASVFLMRSTARRDLGPSSRAAGNRYACFGRSSDLLLGRDQAVFLRLDVRVSRFAARRATAARENELGPIPGPGCFRSDRTLVFVPRRLRAGRRRHASDRDRGDAEELPAGRVRYRHEPALDRELRRCFLLSRSILSKRDFIWVWWNFAFLPLPPRSMAELSLVAEAMANVFINPASVLTPLTLPSTALLAAVLALIGCVSLGRRWAGGLFIPGQRNPTRGYRRGKQ